MSEGDGGSGALLVTVGQLFPSLGWKNPVEVNYVLSEFLVEQIREDRIVDATVAPLPDPTDGVVLTVTLIATGKLPGGTAVADGVQQAVSAMQSAWLWLNAGLSANGLTELDEEIIRRMILFVGRDLQVCYLDPPDPDEKDISGFIRAQLLIEPQP
ncbi:hypothetical protein Ae168Ps1_6051c [Pseudonocardia sp. Ae168_Ps1]|uniref:hypothetical protein n=1 Tax=unclassified Pseudonocardia TaxID=2619320 RepID=UPI00094AE259|nr:MULTISPECIES: hypothetical protein [unclassified Pseudonocardia]OLL70191.1 hypothetical protein Ae150APs1_5994c [Pseudonocardia sp. Ae150A_Ps1]OLL70586.1 hypothetical protein Ae168Ps1_6051c [Pseudonocardia sp. Ae168_Ps1]OLL70812.1 hypothetical protein Ae263Ps1_6226c [Pseudonocardia sp. Ae263_Ps1]OLL89371.1 hypothetical protein Ae356Ps1_6115c [Pseudonocardia sp. Ae356_Ps1]